MVFRITPFDEPEIISRWLLHMPYGLYGLSGGKLPRLGDGAGTRVITMDVAFAEMPDAVCCLWSANCAKGPEHVVRCERVLAVNHKSGPVEKSSKCEV